MTYCVGIMTRDGLVLASDSRTNAGFDQVNISRKLHTFVIPGERAFVVLSSGSLSLTQSILTLLRTDFDAGEGLAKAENFYAAARAVGECVRRVADMDRAALERDDYKFNVHLILGGQIKGEETNLYLIYPQGNPIRATPESPYLQIGEYKYGRPILDRGIVYSSSSIEVASMYALLSFDATMRSNVTVGPPIEVVCYRNDCLHLNQYRSFAADDPELLAIHSGWEQALRKSVQELPRFTFRSEQREEERR